MKYAVFLQILLLGSLAFGADRLAACEFASKSIVSRSSWGLAQVSNVGDILIDCRVSARRFPAKRGEMRHGLTVVTNVYRVSSDGTQQLVPSAAHSTGAGTQEGWEWVEFYVHIPLETKEQDEEASKYLAKIDEEMKKENRQTPVTVQDHQRAMERMREVVYQHRLGQFQLECQVLDGNRVVGTGVVDLEVLFKGRFSDIGLPGVPPA